MRTSRLRNGAVALTTLMVLSACGTTLPRDGSQAAVATDGSGLSVPNASESQTGSGSVASGGGTGSSTAVGSTSGAGSSGDSGGGTGSGGSGAGGGSSAPGASQTGSAGDLPDVVKVGVVGFDVRALYAVFGASPGDGDVFAPVKRFFDYMNERGGLGGRQIEGVYETVDVAEDQNAAAQRACESFTTDNRVELVFGFANEVFLSCVEQYGIPVFDSSFQTSDRMTIDHPNLFQPLGLPMDRLMRAELELGLDEGFIEPGATLGVLYEDCPWGRRIYDGVVKEIADRHDIERVPATTKCVENLVSDLGPFTNQVQQAVLKFQSSGVTHVLMLTAAEGFGIGQFQQAAVQQQYHPKYLFSTAGFPFNNTHPDSAVQWQHSELANMLGIGLLPFIDVGFGAAPANEAQTATRAKCAEVDPALGTEGATEEHDKAQRTSVFYSMCDTFLLVKALGDATGGRLDLPTLSSGYRSVLESYPSATVVGGRLRFVDDRPVGAGYMQPIRFNDGKRPPVYFGALRELS